MSSPCSSPRTSPRRRSSCPSRSSRLSSRWSPPWPSPVVNVCPCMHPCTQACMHVCLPPVETVLGGATRCQMAGGGSQHVRAGRACGRSRHAGGRSDRRGLLRPTRTPALMRVVVSCCPYGRSQQSLCPHPPICLSMSLSASTGGGARTGSGSACATFTRLSGWYFEYLA